MGTRGEFDVMCCNGYMYDRGRGVDVLTITYMPLALPTLYIMMLDNDSIV